MYTQAVVETNQLFQKTNDGVQKETSVDVMRTILRLILNNREANIVINIQPDFNPFTEFESLRKLLSLLFPDNAMPPNQMIKNHDGTADFIQSDSARDVGYRRIRHSGFLEVENEIGNKETIRTFMGHKDRLSSYVLSSNRLIEFVDCHEIPYDWYRSSFLYSTVEIPLIQVFFGTKLTSGSVYEYMYSRAIAEESISGEKLFFVL